MLTDLPVGLWTSAVTLDLVGGHAAQPAATAADRARPAAAGPTAWTGWAEWSALDHRDQRVGVVHAVSNGAAVALFASSWRPVAAGSNGAAALGLAAASALTLGGYLGGHLVANGAAAHAAAPAPVTPPG